MEETSGVHHKRNRERLEGHAGSYTILGYWMAHYSLPIGYEKPARVLLIEVLKDNQISQVSEGREGLDKRLVAYKGQDMISAGTLEWLRSDLPLSVVLCIIDHSLQGS